VRVIAGEAKGRQLKAVPGIGTRPILDRVKVALFDTLGATVGGSRFLDLFAGTGGVGIEALSRGAERSTFVENAPRALAVLRENLARTGLGDRAAIVPADVGRFLAHGGAAGFQIIFLAPPQYLGLAPLALAAIDATEALDPEVVVVVQQDPKEPLAEGLVRLRLDDQRRYGTTVLLYYQQKHL
jgi:16S rRNA (guanine966-N2)-methyltransferase